MKEKHHALWIKDKIGLTCEKSIPGERHEHRTNKIRDPEPHEPEI